MPLRSYCVLPLLCALLGGTLAGCASRPINPPIATIDRAAGYRNQTRPPRDNSANALVVLAFSGGGTRAAAFSFGVLEELRRTEITDAAGKRIRLLDEVDVITGVSGGSFTALAYGLYGERLFDEYEQRFLKRNVQGELIARFFAPKNWTSLWSDNWGRSEMATDLYNEILFENATFGDLAKKPGPLIVATATDISTGSRIGFVQPDFDLICSDLSAVQLARAAAASSAVPLVLSPVTFNNYGGTCGFKEPSWVRAVADPANRARPAGRALQRYKEMQSFQDGANRPYLHLVDGGVSDNLGMRAVLETLEIWEASRAAKRGEDAERYRRVVVFVVNSLSSPRTNWDQSERPPGDVSILIKAAGVPIDRYSYEAVELLKDLIARWQTARMVRASSAFAGGNNPALSRAADAPDVEVYAIDVSFAADPDPAEREFLNETPTSFVLSDEQVDRLRAAAGRIIEASPDFQRLLRDIGAKVIPKAPPTQAAAPR
jgi:NTE family protein